jgi:hypothetical protein
MYSLWISDAIVANNHPSVFILRLTITVG